MSVSRQDAPPEPAEKKLFGDSQPWNTSTLVWNSVTDRVRGGSSLSFLDPCGASSVVFRGVLDTTTLGGAGFASQSTKAISMDGGDIDEPTWDLSSYDGLILVVSSVDDKTYTVTLKDELPRSKRNDGREQSGITWEADFRLKTQGELMVGSRVLPIAQLSSNSSNDYLYRIVIPWEKFTATYRGRDMPDAKPLQTNSIRRFGLMMRSFFEKQEGDFKIIIRYIAAFRFEEISEAKVGL